MGNERLGSQLNASLDTGTKGNARREPDGICCLVLYSANIPCLVLPTNSQLCSLPGIHTRRIYIHADQTIELGRREGEIYGDGRIGAIYFSRLLRLAFSRRLEGKRVRMRRLNDNGIAKLTLLLLLAHNGRRVLLGLLVLRTRQCILVLLLGESAVLEPGFGNRWISTNRRSGLLLGLGPIGIALITPSHGVLKRRTKERGSGLRTDAIGG